MAFSKARRLSDFIAADGTIPTGKFASSSITSSHLVDGTIAHADLHTDMDLTGKTVLVANASTGDSDTTAANTAFVQQEIAALVDSSPGTLNTLNELAAALGDDANFSTTITNSIATKLPLAGGTMTGHTLHGDNIFSKYGTGNDFEIYFNGTHGVIRTASSSVTGNIYIQDDNNIVLGSIGGETYLNAAKDGAVTLYHDNSPKLQTTAAGIDVTGTISSGAITLGSGVFVIKNAATDSNGLRIFQDTSDAAKIYNHYDGTLQLGVGNTTALTIDSSENTTFAGNIKTTGHLELAASQPRIILDRSDGSYSWNIYNGDGSGNFPTSTFNIANNAGVPVLTILDDGRVGMGASNTSPGFALHVRHATTNVVARFESQDNQVWIDLHDDGSGNYGALLGHDSDNNILFRVANADVDDKLILSPSGNLTIAGQLELIDGNNYIVADQSTATRIDFYLNNTVAGAWKRTGSGGSIRPNQYSSGDTAANLPALASYDDEDTGVFFPEADKVGFSAGGNNIFTVKNTGQIEARGEVTGTRIVASVQDMFNMGAEKSEHPMITGTGRTYVDGGSSNYQGYRFATENFFPPVFIPYSPNQVYRVSASLYQLQGSTASGGANSRHYFGLAGYDENFNFLQTDGIGTYQYILGSNFTLSTGSTQEMDVTMKGWQGSGGTDGNKMDQGTVYIRPLALINYQSAGALAVLTGFNIMPAGTVADNDSNAGTNY